MCEPVTALTAVSGGLKAFGGLQSAAAEKDAAARQWEQQMELRAINFMRDQTRYKLKTNRYLEEVDENFLLASTAYGKEQAWLNDQLTAATVKYNDSFKKMAKYAKGLEMSGVTGSRVRSVPIAELGFRQAMNIANLTRAREKVEGFGRETRRKLVRANRRSRDMLGFVPMPGIAPPKPDMDMSSAYIGALGTLAGTAASSFKAFNASQPTPGFQPTPGYSYSDSQKFFNYQPEFTFSDFPSNFKY